MGARSKVYHSLGALGDCDPSMQSCYGSLGNPYIYGQDGGYSPLPNSAPVGNGVSGPSCDPSTQSCPPPVGSAPVGTGGVTSPGGTFNGYTPNIDYGPGGSSGSGSASTGSSGISVVTEGASGILGFFQGTLFGLPRWLVLGLGGLAAYKLSKGRR